MRRQSGLYCVLVGYLLLLAIYTEASTEPAISTATRYSRPPDDGPCGRNLMGRSPFHRFRQSWMLRELGEKKVPPSRKTKAPGSQFSLRFPSRERVAAWFGASNEDDAATTVHSWIQRTKFNHDLVGMTNPTLRIDENDAPVGFARRPVSADTNRQTSSSRRRTNDDPSSSLASVAAASAKRALWWPGVAYTPDSTWRVLRFVQTVGRGLDCYHACRDAALQWEFETGSKGMVLVTQPSRSGSVQQRRRWSYGDDGGVVACSVTDSVQQIWSGPGRRLVTYTATGIKWSPKLYTINPVTVVYDLVDQRGPSTTYTSTAYATCVGHLLRGEERVTVCHRDDDEGTVDVEILSYSKPANSLMGRMVWPLIGGMQRAFFQQQMQSFQRVAEESAKREGTPLFHR